MELFRRLHLSTLWQRKVSTVLVVAGIAVGTATLFAVALLLVAIGRPFSSLVHAAAAEKADLAVNPVVEGRLPESLVRTIRETPGVEVASPFVGGLTTLFSEHAESGALVAGVDCSIELLTTPFECGSRFAAAAPGPGVPLGVSENLARTLGVAAGDPLAIPGRALGAAHVGAVLPAGTLAALDDGNWAFGLVPDVQDLDATGPYLTTILVRSADPAMVTSAVAGVATTSTPGRGTGVFLTLTRGLLAFAGMLVLVSGAMIAANSFTLSLDDRRKSLAIVEVLGSSPAATVLRLSGEGAILGALGGLVAAVPAFLLGRWLAGTIGSDLLAGTGAGIGVSWSWWIPPATMAVGILAGVASAFGPAIRMIHTGSDVAIREQAGVLPVHAAPRWPIAGLALILGAAPLVWLYGTGRAPLVVALAGVGVATTGLVLSTFGIAPVVVAGLTRVVGEHSVVGLLAGSDLTRDPVRLAAVVTAVGLGSAVAVGALSITSLTADSLASHLATEAGDRVYVFPRTNGAQVSNNFDEEALRAIDVVPGVAEVIPQYLAVVDTGVNGANIQGTDPRDGMRRGNLDFAAGTDVESAWAGVAAGDAIVSRVLANRWSVAAGDTITIPSVSGTRTLEVAAVAQPRFAQDNGIADVVIVNQEVARSGWAAALDFVIAVPDAGVAASELAGRIDTTSGLQSIHALDAAGLRAEARRTAARFLGPVELIGYTLVVIAALAVTNFLILGMIQRRRLRAVLSFVGFEPAIERRTLVVQALVMGVLGGICGALGAIMYAWLTTLGSPALLASPVPWRVVPVPLLVGMALAVGSCLLATIPPSVEAGNLDALDALTEE
ncbi:MAG: ABC transporter permease [Acidimicrobiia bacterium]